MTKIKDKPDKASWEYYFDFVDQMPAGCTIEDADFEVREGDVIVSDVTPDGTKIRFTFSGGTPGTQCEVMIFGTTNLPHIKPAHIASVYIIG